MAFDPISAIAEVAGKVLDRVLPDKAANDAAKARVLEMVIAGDIQQMTGQLEVNKVEAASQSLFVAGWRPFIGWVCGSGLVYEFILRPLLTFGCNLFGKNVVSPNLDLSQLIPLLVGMLGLGAMRTAEKLQGVSGTGH